MNAVVEIGWLQLALCLLFILIAAGASLALKLGLHRDLAVGTVRTFSQLLLLGLVLNYVFEIDRPLPVLALFWCMVLFSVSVIRGRIQKQPVRYLDATFLSMFLSFTLINFLVNRVVVQVDPWYTPRYFLPLGGMIIGNSMNAIALSLDRLFGELNKGKHQIEMKLSLGATWREATREEERDAIKAGMIPSINAMMGVGIVFIPGMMTGQILAGADPLMAVRYQVMVMLMLVASTSLCSVLVIDLVLRRCFSREGTLRF